MCDAPALPKAPFCSLHYKLKNRPPPPPRRKPLRDNIRLRCWVDRKHFDQPAVHITAKNIIKLLTPDQLAHSTHWAIVPIDPLLPLAPGNAVVISSHLRMLLVFQWRAFHDTDEYKRILDFECSCL
jgi:hypothetical protein